MQTCTFLRCILKCTHTGLNFVSCGHDLLHSDGKTWGTAQCNPMGGPQNSASGLWCCVSKWHFFPLANPGKKKKVCALGQWSPVTYKYPALVVLHCLLHGPTWVRKYICPNKKAAFSQLWLGYSCFGRNLPEKVRQLMEQSLLCCNLQGPRISSTLTTNTDVAVAVKLFQIHKFHFDPEVREQRKANQKKIWITQFT